MNCPMRTNKTINQASITQLEGIHHNGCIENTDFSVHTLLSLSNPTFVVVGSEAVILEAFMK